MQDEETIDNYTSMISEFILIGLDTPANALIAFGFQACFSSGILDRSSADTC